MPRKGSIKQQETEGAVVEINKGDVKKPEKKVKKKLVKKTVKKTVKKPVLQKVAQVLPQKKIEIKPEVSGEKKFVSPPQPKKIKEPFDITKYLSFGKERDYFIENLSLLVSSGMPVLDAVRVIQKELKSLKMKRVVAGLVTDLEEGGTLWQSLDKTKMFNDYSVSLIRIGEESGRFVENIKLIAEQEEKSKEFKSKIRSASMYPLIVLVLALVVGLGIAYFILPRLALVFSQLNLELPLATKILIGAGVFLQAYGVIVLPAIVLAIILLVYFVFYYPKTKIIGQVILFNIPGVHTLIQEIELNRFGYLLGTLLKAGVPITQACSSLAGAARFSHYKKFYSYLKVRFEEGYLFEESFRDYPKMDKLITGPIQQIIVAGERSGRLADTLIKISEAFETKTEQTTKNLSTALEPILLIFIWLGVLGIAIAVILPIYSLVGGLRDGTTSKQSTNPPPVVQEVEPISAIEQPVVPVPVLRILDKTDFVNVRDEPNIEGELLLVVYPGEEFEFVDEQDGWYEIVLYESETAWVSGDYVEIIEDGEINSVSDEQIL